MAGYLTSSVSLQSRREKAVQIGKQMVQNVIITIQHKYCIDEQVNKIIKCLEIFNEELETIKNRFLSRNGLI